MSNERAVLSDVSDGLATLTLNKPAKLNAWDTPMRAEIATILRNWNGDGRVRAVIVTGAGKRAFSAGQDLDETEKFSSGSDGANWFQSWRDFYNAIRDLDKPCVAALNGVAAGSAFQAAMPRWCAPGPPPRALGCVASTHTPGRTASSALARRKRRLCRRLRGSLPTGLP